MKRLDPQDEVGEESEEDDDDLQIVDKEKQRSNKAPVRGVRERYGLSGNGDRDPYNSEKSKSMAPPIGRPPLQKTTSAVQRTKGVSSRHAQKERIQNYKLEKSNMMGSNQDNTSMNRSLNRSVSSYRSNKSGAGGSGHGKTSARGQNTSQIRYNFKRRSKVAPKLKQSQMKRKVDTFNSKKSQSTVE